MKTTINNCCLKNEIGHPMCHPSKSPSTPLRVTSWGKPLRMTEDECDAAIYAAWPSPANDKVQIPYLLPEGISGYLFIADAKGRDIAVVELQEGLNTLELDISTYPEGTYYYGFRSNAGNCSVNKLVIIH